MAPSHREDLVQADACVHWEGWAPRLYAGDQLEEFCHLHHPFAFADRAYGGIVTQRFPRNSNGHVSRFSGIARSDVARLTDRQCALFGEKLLELANYAVAALIFGQLVGAQRISLALMLTGGASYIALVLVALWLTGDE
jgi:hypothetical protein